MDKEAERRGNIYHYERTKNARYTLVQTDDADSTKSGKQLNRISEKSAQR